MLVDRVQIIRDLLRNVKLFPRVDSQRFFKVGEGQYSSHDKFLGVSHTHLRKIASDYPDLTTNEFSELLSSPFNEERGLALIALGNQCKSFKSSCPEKENLVNFYVNNLSHVNNWNLVDISAHVILGEHLYETTGPSNMELLLRLAESSNLWERRVSMVSTWAFIHHNEFYPTITIAEKLLPDPEDLIHKATGWMLREMGKRNEQQLITFLDQHVSKMPATMLSYATERLSRKEILNYRSLRKASIDETEPKRKKVKSVKKDL